MSHICVGSVDTEVGLLQMYLFICTMGLQNQYVPNPLINQLLCDRSGLFPQIRLINFIVVAPYFAQVFSMVIIIKHETYIFILDLN